MALRIFKEVSMTIPTLILATLLGGAQSVSFDVKDMKLTDFFRLLADAGSVNVVVHPAVEGNISLTIKDVPWDQLLDVVTKNYGLEKEVTGNIVRIVPVRAIEAEYRQRAAAEQARLNALPLQTRVYVLHYGRAEDIAAIVSKFLSPRGSVVVYRPLNALIVRDIGP
jgi:type II secretory pathway component HofQ